MMFLERSVGFGYKICSNPQNVFVSLSYGKMRMK